MQALQVEITQGICSMNEDIHPRACLSDVILIYRGNLTGSDLLVERPKMLVLDAQKFEAIGGDLFFRHKHRFPRKAIRMLEVCIHEKLAFASGHTWLRWEAG